MKSTLTHNGLFEFFLDLKKSNSFETEMEFYSASIDISSISFQIGWVSVIRPTVFEIKIDEICIDSSCLEKDVIPEKTNASEYSFVQIQWDAPKNLDDIFDQLWAFINEDVSAEFREIIKI
jgi:hypothetical protein